MLQFLLISALSEVSYVLIGLSNNIIIKKKRLLSVFLAFFTNIVFSVVVL